MDVNSSIARNQKNRTLRRDHVERMAEIDGVRRSCNSHYREKEVEVDKQQNGKHVSRG